MISEVEPRKRTGFVDGDENSRFVVFHRFGNVFFVGGGGEGRRAKPTLAVQLQLLPVTEEVVHNGLVRKPRSGAENGQLADEINDDIAARRNGRGST